MRHACSESQLRVGCLIVDGAGALEYLPLVLEPLTRVLVSRVNIELAPPAHREYRPAEHDERPHDREFCLSERGGSKKAANHSPGVRNAARAPENVGGSHCELSDSPRHRRVPEIDDPQRAASIAEHVIGSNVAVDHLARQRVLGGAHRSIRTARGGEAALTALEGQCVGELFDNIERAA